MKAHVDRTYRFLRHRGNNVFKKPGWCNLHQGCNCAHYGIGEVSDCNKNMQGLQCFYFNFSEINYITSISVSLVSTTPHGFVSLE